MGARKPKKRTKDERQEIYAALEAWISEGKTLREFCRQRGNPPWQTVYHWLEADPEAQERIARARLLGEEAIAEECLAIADTPQIGEETKTDADGEIEYKRGDMLGHRKLQIETRLKLLAKWNPKKWGEKVGMEHSGKVAVELTTEQTDAALRAAGLVPPLVVAKD